MVAVLDDSHIEQADHWGYSMGASKRLAALAPDARFVRLEGHDHTTAFQENAAVIPYVREFLGLV